MSPLVASPTGKSIAVNVGQVAYDAFGSLRAGYDVMPASQDRIAEAVGHRCALLDARLSLVGEFACFSVKPGRRRQSLHVTY
jgi:hypothetical protein